MVRSHGAVVPLLVLLAALALPAGARAGEPTDALRDFFGAVNVVLNDPTTEEQPMERLRAIRRHVDDIFDFREASKLALGREWAGRTPVEQNEFVALFADLLERSFVWRVAGKATTAGGVKVDYLGETIEADTAGVETAIAARDGNPMRLGFRMVRRSGRWVVRDVVMDGVSTMENYHAQFQRLARDGSWPDVMAQLRAKVGTPAGTVQVAAAPPPMMWPSELRAPDRVAEPLVSVPSPPVPAAIARPLETAVVEPADSWVSAAPEIITARPVSPPRQTPPPAPRAAAAARDIALATSAPARVEPRVEPTPVMSRAVMARPATAAAWWVQVGAYRSASAAGKVAALVQGEILVVVSPVEREAPLLRVRVGPFADRAHALDRLQELEAQGWRAILVQ
ncbi:MAG TPA: ABC transporter substrate-binding protein [Candidatus Binatia bacterium]|nr:ABC transporter substrate-binding protein [Candidatus Binatia bacterium]